jgi:anti-anti-sigma regulatory factor
MTIMKFYLIVAKGKKQGMPIPITVDLFLIGSDKVCQLRSGKPGIGPQQCALVTRERKVFVRDLNSGPPTLLNGALVPPGVEWPLHAGDRLEIGPLEFMIQFREKPLSQRDLEEWALKCLDHRDDREFEDPDEALCMSMTDRTSTPAQAAASILDKLQARRGLVMGRLRIGKEGSITIVRFNDVYLVEEAEIALVKKELYEHLSKPNLRVLLDCKNIRRMSTVAVSMIDEVQAWLRPWGSTLALCRVRPELKNILSQLDLRQPIQHFTDKHVALDSKW